MSAIYQRNLKVRAEHVDYRQNMKLSSFMTLFQECCIAHTEELGMGRDMTLDRGFLWVIISEHIVINRMPVYDEDIILECYQTPTLHYFFPRSLIVKNDKGEVLIKAVALWSLIDSKTRQFIDPQENKIIIKETLKDDIVMPVIGLKVPALNNKKTFTASYSKVDINGHLGNTYYMDLMNDIMFEKEAKDIKEIKLIFKKEIQFNARFALNFSQINNKFYFKSKYFESEFTFK